MVEYEEIPATATRIYGYNYYTGCEFCGCGWFDICVNDVVNGKSVSHTIWTEYYDYDSYCDAVEKYKLACSHYNISIDEDEDEDLSGERVL